MSHGLCDRSEHLQRLRRLLQHLPERTRISHDVKAEKNSIDPEYCVSCNLCSSFCERNAIRRADGSFTPYKGWDIVEYAAYRHSALHGLLAVH